MALKHILCVISIFLLPISMHGQVHESSLSVHEEKLARYELICGRCLELKILVAEGKQVSRTTAAGMIDDFLSMNKEIKDELEFMSPTQKIRFEMINHWFSTGTKPLAMDHVSSLVKISPEPKTYAVTYANPVKFTHSISNYNVESVSRKSNTIRTLIMAGISFPVSYSLMAGLQGTGREQVNWGGYMRLSSNLRFTESEYECLGNGTFNNGSAFWGNGNTERTHITTTIGALAGPLPWLDIYAGAGYGKSTLLWQDIEGSWASVQDFSYKGLAAEAGIITSWRSLCLGLGISTINFSTVSIDLSVGITWSSIR